MKDQDKTFTYTYVHCEKESIVQSLPSLPKDK